MGGAQESTFLTSSSQVMVMLLVRGYTLKNHCCKIPSSAMTLLCLQWPCTGECSPEGHSVSAAVYPLPLRLPASWKVCASPFSGSSAKCSCELTAYLMLIEFKYSVHPTERAHFPTLDHALSMPAVFRILSPEAPISP